MIWKISNIISAIIAGFLAKDKITAIMLKRSIFIFLNKVFGFLKILIISSMCLFFVVLIFNFSKYLDIFNTFVNRKIKVIENISFFNSHKKQINIDVNNTILVSKSEINSILLKYTANKSLLFVNINKIAQDLQQLDFVKDVYIKRKFSNTLKIIIYEKDILFILKLNNDSDSERMFFSIDSDGAVSRMSGNKIPSELSSRPIIYSDCYNETFLSEVSQMHKILLPIGSFYKKIDYLDFKNCKEWTIKLQNGNILLLNPDNEHRSIYKYINNEDKFNLSSLENNRIDLRFDGKIYIKTINNNNTTFDE